MTDTYYTGHNGEAFFVRDGQYHDVDVFVVNEVPQDYLWEKLVNVRTALDVGAHIGVWTREFKRRFPHAKVICAEPHPDNFRLLKRNTETLSDVTRVNQAVQYRERYYVLDEHPVNSGGHTTIAVHRNDDEHVQEAVTLEWLLGLWGMHECDLLKLDCEGAEVDIIRHGDIGAFKQIIGEYHAGVDNFVLSCQPRLIAEGFRVELYPHKSWPLNGIFYAERIDDHAL